MAEQWYDESNPEQSDSESQEAEIIGEEQKPKQSKDERSVIIADLRKKINKKFGKGTTAPGNKLLVEMERIPTGIFSLDEALGGGIPAGRMIMLKGDESASKTTIALRAIGNAQNMCSNCWGWPTCTCGENRDAFCCFLDQEGALDILWSERFVDLSRLEVQRPITAEETVEVGSWWLRSGQVDLLVLDSLAAMATADEIEGKSHMGQLPRLGNEAMRRWQSAQNECRKKYNRIPTIILINQVRSKIGVVFGDPRTYPGGHGQRFSTTADIELRKGKYTMDKDTGSPISVSFGFRVSKNKSAPANRSGEFIMMMADTETKQMGDIYDEKVVVAESEQFGIVKKEGKTYRLGEQTFASKIDTIKYMLENRDVFEELKLELMKLKLRQE